MTIFIKNGFYQIGSGFNSDYLLDVGSGNITDFSNVQLYTNNNTDNNTNNNADQTTNNNDNSNTTNNTNNSTNDNALDDDSILKNTNDDALGEDVLIEAKDKRIAKLEEENVRLRKELDNLRRLLYEKK